MFLLLQKVIASTEHAPRFAQRMFADIPAMCFCNYQSSVTCVQSYALLHAVYLITENVTGSGWHGQLIL